MKGFDLNQQVRGGKRQRGQGLSEYIIILALVAIAAIGVHSAFGSTLQAQVAQITNGVAGNSNGLSTNSAAAMAAAGTATADAANLLGMNSYGGPGEAAGVACPGCPGFSTTGIPLP
jgi:Flp pilus assembly pilin Flp